MLRYTNIAICNLHTHEHIFNDIQEEALQPTSLNNDSKSEEIGCSFLYTSSRYLHISRPLAIKS